MPVPQNGPRILIVEENGYHGMLMEQQLARRLDRPLVVLVKTYEQALKAIQHQKFDIAVVDFSITGCSGTHLVRVLHHSDPELALIVVAENISEQMTKEVFGCGCEELLIKDSSYYAVIPRMVSGLYRRRQSLSQRADKPALPSERSARGYEHELAEPLNTILQTAEKILTENGCIDDEMTSRITAIHRSAQQLKHLFERTETRQKEGSISRIDKVLAGQDESCF
ncbi:MAG: response regulator [Candidatus Zixiibacteriota bacterium]